MGTQDSAPPQRVRRSIYMRAEDFRALGDLAYVLGITKGKALEIALRGFLAAHPETAGKVKDAGKARE